MENFKIKLDKYAELAVKVGVNVQQNQTLVVNAPLVAADFVRLVSKKAYAAGAKHVHVFWNDDELNLIKFMNAPDESFEEFPKWKAESFEQLAKDGAAFLSIIAPNPDLLKDVNPQRIASSSKAAGKAMDGYRNLIQSGNNAWGIVSIPSKAWAEKVFPNLNEEDRIKKLWDTIFSITRVDAEDTVKAWNDHVENLGVKSNYLNEKKFKKLHFKAPGTDLTVELPEGHIWEGGGDTTNDGVYFMPNIPTEEIFTLPTKTGVNGVLSSTKPLNYGGNLIDNFKFTFENGKIVDFSAEQGYEILKTLVETDEGSHYLGEVALVPDDSPISNSNLVFSNTLFDENASCHFAIGTAYPSCLEGGTKMSKEELETHGANTSLTHVDFMVGSIKMNIDGETSEGEMIPIFRNGNWAI